MIKIENAVFPSAEWMETVIMGMRNPMNSWDKSDSRLMNPTEVEFGYEPNYQYVIGEADMTLTKKLCAAGCEHRKFMRQIPVIMDITAPLYWWKEFDTYKVGTVANSCSTMHKIHEKEFELDDFSHERLTSSGAYALKQLINDLNSARYHFLKTKRKHFWWDMIQLLPTSYNQRRTVSMNYEVLLNIYHQRKDHKLDEWREFCEFVKNNVPHFKEIAGI